jgi:hypothetical protein
MARTLRLAVAQRTVPGDPTDRSGLRATGQESTESTCGPHVQPIRQGPSHQRHQWLGAQTASCRRESLRQRLNRRASTIERRAAARGAVLAGSSAHRFW